MAYVTPPRLDFYSTADRWRWRLVASNGRIIAASAQGNGFASKGGARRNFECLQKLLSMDRYECTNGEADCLVMVTWVKEAE